MPAACGSASDGIREDEYQEADGTPVWISGGFVAPARSPGCPQPYLDAAATCGSYRLAVWDPVTGPAFGPWIRSCATPPALAPSLKGWVHPGDTVWVEQQSRAGDARATQFTIYM